MAPAHPHQMQPCSVSYAGFALPSGARPSARVAYTHTHIHTLSLTLTLSLLLLLLIHSYNEKEQRGSCQQAMGWLPTPRSAGDPIPTRLPHIHLTSPPWCRFPLEQSYPGASFPWSCTLNYGGTWVPRHRAVSRQMSASNNTTPSIAPLALM